MKLEKALGLLRRLDLIVATARAMVRIERDDVEVGKVSSGRRNRKSHQLAS